MKKETLMMVIAILLLVSAIIALTAFNLQAQEQKGFTELYFLGELPEQIKLNEEHSFAFALHNFEHRDMNYSYVVLLDDAALSEGNVVLSHEQTRVIKEKFILNEKKSPSIQVTVKLLNNYQDIHFWADLI